jgi:hypothetical protein
MNEDAFRIGKRRTALSEGRSENPTLPESDVPPVAPPYKLRWYQYSLRSLFIFMTLCALACSWFAVRKQRAERQAQAVTCVARLGATIEYDYQYDYEQEHALDEGPLDAPDPPGPQWLRERLGDDLYNGWASYSVASIDFQSYAKGEKGYVPEALVSDGDLHVLCSFPKLRYLGLTFQPITDRGIKDLGELNRLEYLDLYGTKVTDDAVHTLLKFHNLKRLNVGQTHITLEGLRRLLGETKLECLELSGNQIADFGGWEKIKSLFPNVEIVRIDRKKGGGIETERQ